MSNEEYSLIPYSPPRYVYWIMSFPLYGNFVFYGTEAQARDLWERTGKRENEKGRFWEASPGNEKDRAMVIKEIIAVREDKAAGIKLPFYPGRGWL